MSIITSLLCISSLTPVVPAIVPAQGDPLPRRGVFGASFAPVPAETATKLNLKSGTGAILSQPPVPGFTADKAQLKQGDILVSINGAAVSQPTIGAMVRGIASGTTLKMKIFRDGKEMEISSPFVERPRDPGNNNYEVIYSHIVSHGKRMRTIITVPKKPGKHPGFFFIQGFSPISYDFTLEGSKGDVASIDGPLLYHFANSNFVTMRVEKPGVGDSEGGPFAEMDYITEMDIYRQAIKQLKEVKTVDNNNIFIFGHSMGGAFGPMIASEVPVKGIATYGTAARTWFEYILDTVRYQGLVGGQTFEAADEELRVSARLLALVFLERKSVDEVKKSHPQLSQLADAFFPGGLFNGKTLEFWRQLNDTNFAKYWANTTAHVFAVRGFSDFVTYDADHKLIADAVNQKNPGKGKWAIAPNSDHLFHDFPTEQESMKNFQRGKFNLEFTKMLDAWIREVMAK